MRGKSKLINSVGAVGNSVRKGARQQQKRVNLICQRHKADSFEIENQKKFVFKKKSFYLQNVS